MFLDCVVLSDLYSVQEVVILNTCFVFSRNLILSSIDKRTPGTQSLRFFIWNVAPAVCIAGTSWTGGLVFGLAGIPGVIDISNIIHSFDNDKSKFYFTVNQ